jgi:hypothetical protein
MHTTNGYGTSTLDSAAADGDGSPGPQFLTVHIALGMQMTVQHVYIYVHTGRKILGVFSSLKRVKNVLSHVLTLFGK